MSAQVISAKVREYKSDVVKLESSLKHSKQACLDEVSKLAENCYDAFNDMQMSLAKLKKDDPEKYDTIQKDSYKRAYDLLAFFETKINADFYVYIINNSTQFNKLIQHYSKYCERTEKEYNILLESEKGLVD